MAAPLKQVLMLMPGCEVRGSTVQALTLAQGLPARGYSATVLCGDASQVPADKRDGARFLERPSLGWSLAMPIVRHFLARDLDTSPPAVIHAQHRQTIVTAVRDIEPVAILVQRDMRRLAVAGEILRNRAGPLYAGERTIGLRT